MCGTTVYIYTRDCNCEAEQTTESSSQNIKDDHDCSHTVNEKPRITNQSKPGLKEQLWLTGIVSCHMCCCVTALITKAWEEVFICTLKAFCELKKGIKLMCSLMRDICSLNVQSCFCFILAYHAWV